MKYRKKPVEIEAIQWKGNNFEEIKQFAGEMLVHEPVDFSNKPYGILYINDYKQGRYIVKVGDYIIKGKTKLYHCNFDTFQMLFKEVEE